MRYLFWVTIYNDICCLHNKAIWHHIKDNTYQPVLLSSSPDLGLEDTIRRSWPWPRMGRSWSWRKSLGLGSRPLQDQDLSKTWEKSWTFSNQWCWFCSFATEHRIKPTMPLNYQKRSVTDITRVTTLLTLWNSPTIRGTPAHVTWCSNTSVIVND